jgi:hypothetical protein
MSSQPARQYRCGEYARADGWAVEVKVGRTRLLAVAALQLPGASFGVASCHHGAHRRRTGRDHSVLLGAVASARGTSGGVAIAGLRRFRESSSGHQLRSRSGSRNGWRRSGRPNGCEDSYRILWKRTRRSGAGRICTTDQRLSSPAAIDSFLSLTVAMRADTTTIEAQDSVRQNLAAVLYRSETSVAIRTQM